jgi:hypothetical protein
MSTIDAIEDVLVFARIAQSGSWGRKDLCAFTTLDVENAFSGVPWEGIAEEVHLHCDRDKVEDNVDAGSHEYKVGG